MIYGGQVLIVIFFKFVCILSLKFSPSIQSRTAKFILVITRFFSKTRRNFIGFLERFNAFEKRKCVP